MNNRLRKLIRTILVHFPLFQDVKPVFQRVFYMFFNVAFESDFKALEFFPVATDLVYLDIGGNRGYAIDTMIMFNRNCHVISFEPNSVLADGLAKRYQKKKNVTIYPFGLGNENGEFKLFVPFYRKYIFDAYASLDKNQVKSCVNNNMFYLFNETQLQIREYSCQVKKLDDFNISPFFIKLDVQGHELSVLKGGVETIRSATPIILIESVEDVHLDFLGQFGYKVYRYDVKQNKYFLNERGALNSFLMTDEKYKLLLGGIKKY